MFLAERPEKNTLQKKEKRGNPREPRKEEFLMIIQKCSFSMNLVWIKQSSKNRYFFMTLYIVILHSKQLDFTHW